MLNPLENKTIKKELVEAPVTEKPITQKTDGHIGIPIDNELEKIYLARNLGMENFDDMKKYQDQLERLIAWAREKGATSREDIAWQVKSLAGRVGGPQFGNNIVQHLSQWAYLEMERNRLDRQMKEMSVNG